MKTFSKFLLIAAMTLALCDAAFAQMPTSTTTNGWPIINENPYPPVIGTLGAGPYTVLNPVQVPPFTTNSFVPGQTSSTNTYGANMNQVFIGSSYWNDQGVSLVVISPTNAAAPFSTNLTGVVTATFEKSIDGVHVDNNSTPITLVCNNSANNCLLASNVVNGVTNWYVPQTAPYSCIFTDLTLNGAAGYFLTSLANTNAGLNAPTNYVYLIVNPKATKNVSIPGTTTQ